MVNNIFRHLNLIKANSKVIFSLKGILCMCIIFVYTFLTKSYLVNDTFAFGQTIKNTFYGPLNLGDNIIETFTWVLYQFFIIFVIGNFIFKELMVRAYYTIPRLGNKSRWHIDLQFACIISCVIYFALGFFIVFIINWLSNSASNFNGLYDVIKILSLLSLASYYFVTVYIINVLVTKNHVQSFIILLITSLVSIELGYVFKIDKYIPFNQGIISKHITGGFSLAWSMIFLIILIIINVVISDIIIVKKDLSELAH
ncbi:MAG: hypothetical protein SPJ62_06950 [Inconstantimicrobium porci]|uniref:hypothetical protein n=1 Tax=Inconstantimicrobium porci TaxID=2652291 RepID=UPI002409888A|nr:hypothetical protein [Inconstantimicrobium porci]MDD6769958.1 hypothetical protein [Inconstantimicrobium porci]MDY5911728.1 hypothetical protein [Inconstantimicrobium porci]